MEIRYIPFFYTLIFALILVAVVPKAEIRRLSIYGIIFGAVFDVVLVSIANITGSFRYINYEPFGLIGIHFLAPISWAIFFIIYFHLLPNKRSYIYLYTVSGVFYSMMFCQMITKLGVLKLSHGLLDSIIPFAFWFPLATWGYAAKSLIMVYSQGNPNAQAFQTSFQSYEAMFKMFGLNVVNTLLQTGGTDPSTAANNQELLSKAYEAGKAI